MPLEIVIPVQRRIPSLLVLLLTGAAACHAAVWRTDSFSITWDDGYTQVPSSNKSKIQLTSTSGIGVTMTAIGHRLTKAEDIQKIREHFIKYGTDELPKLAQRYGTVVLPLKREELDSGVTLFSIAEHNRSKNRFGLFFVHISAQGRTTQIVVEGQGRPEDVVASFRKLVNTARWDE